MSYLKAVITAICILTVLLIGYMYVDADSDHALDMALDSFLQGQNTDANKELVRLKDTLPKAQLELYQAYIARADGRLESSQRLLNDAVGLAHQQGLEEIALEIQLNQALNAYLQGNNGALRSVVDRMASAQPNEPWVIMFRGLQAYQAGDYAKASEQLLRSTDLKPLSDWMKKSFSDVFTPSWRTIHLAKSQIEEGKYLLARGTLEAGLGHASQNDLAMINFLLGLSYAKEAMTKDPSAAMPGWKLAFDYFNKVPVQSEALKAELKRLNAEVMKTFNLLLENREYVDLPQYAVIFQAWSSEAALNDISKVIVVHLNQAVSNSQWSRAEELAALLGRMLPEGPKRQQLQKHFEQLAYESLSQAKYDAVAEYWFVANKLSSNPEEFSTQFASKLEENILLMAINDNDQLLLSTPFIRMWNTIEKNQKARLAFSIKLVNAAGDIWLQPHGDDKAKALIKAALALAEGDQEGQIQQAIQTMISNLYEEANQREASEKLPSILEAVEEYRLGNVDLKEQSQIEKHLISAREMFRQGRFSEAQNRAEWVLRVRTDDPSARLIAGMVAYHKADYERAKNYLENLSLLYPQELEALAVSQIMTGDITGGEKNLKELLAHGSLADDTNLRLALGFLNEGKPRNALIWLDKVHEASPEATIGRAYANFLLGSYEKVAPLLQSVGAPYNALDGVRGLAIQADIAIGSVDTAEKALIKLLNQAEQPSTSGMSAPFQAFERQRLSEFSRYYMAGQFFSKVKKNPQIASKYYRLVKTPTPIVRVARGEALLASNQIEEASKDLAIAVDQNEDRQAQVEAVPLLAAVLYKKQEYLEANDLFKKFYMANPDTDAHRGAYAQLLTKLRRYDLALQQYERIDEEKFTPEDSVGYANSLFHLNRWDDAAKVGDAFLQKQDQPLELLLAMARIMAKIENFRSTWPLLKTLPPVDRLTLSETKELLEFLMEIGSYPQASLVAEEKGKVLEASVQGLLILAKLNEQLSKYQDALAFAQQARHLEPKNLDVYAALGRYARDVGLLETLTAELEQRADKEPENMSLKFAYANQLVDLGTWAGATEDKGASKYAASYRKAIALLDKCLPAYGDIPEVRLVMGQLLSLVNKNAEALASFRSAVQLDPSYSRAYRAIAREYEQQKDDKSAIRALYQAIRYDVDDADAWQRMAELYSQQGDLYEAAQLYQNAIKHSPNNLRLYVALGQILLELRNPEDAQILLTHAADIAPKNGAVLKLLLRTLYDPLLISFADDPRELVMRQKKAYEQLHAIDSQAAEKFLSEVTERRREISADFSLLDNPIFAPELG